MTECICASNANPDESYSWFRNRTFFKSSCFKCLLRCVTTKMGHFKTDGTVDIDGTVAQYRGVLTKDQVTKCVTPQQNNLDLCDKAYQILLCNEKTIRGTVVVY
ncbi:hypothetical protein PPYR_14758 [Photinus pyralis]|uniref:Uncharacterized protein n=1 Tax=Photinus pyralis TaxID=7054 RepID=A0A1Y1MGA1_PHOPY|nr:hypothetical protein PPYR_14758 [Photinus pyralis]